MKEITYLALVKCFILNAIYENFFQPQTKLALLAVLLKDKIKFFPAYRRETFQQNQIW